MKNCFNDPRRDWQTLETGQINRNFIVYCSNINFLILRGMFLGPSEVAYEAVRRVIITILLHSGIFRSGMPIENAIADENYPCCNRNTDVFRLIPPKSLKSALCRPPIRGAIVGLSGQNARKLKPEEIAQPCRMLLSSRGEASGISLSREILTRYRQLSGMERTSFFVTLSTAFSVDMDAAPAAARAYLEEASLENLGAPGKPTTPLLHTLDGSFGIMVDYRYQLDEIERNHEKYANDGIVIASASVLKLA